MDSELQISILSRPICSLFTCVLTIHVDLIPPPRLSYNLFAFHLIMDISIALSASPFGIYILRHFYPLLQSPWKVINPICFSMDAVWHARYFHHSIFLFQSPQRLCDCSVFFSWSTLIYLRSPTDQTIRPKGVALSDLGLAIRWYIKPLIAEAAVLFKTTLTFIWTLIQQNPTK